MCKHGISKLHSSHIQVVGLVEARFWSALRKSSPCSLVLLLVCRCQEQAGIHTSQLATSHALQGIASIMCLVREAACMVCPCGKGQTCICTVQVVPGTLTGKKDIVEIQHRVLVRHCARTHEVLASSAC